MNELITNQILEAVLTVVGILIAAAVSYFSPKLKSLLEKIQEKDNIGIMSGLASDAVEMIEARFKDIDGNDKFEEALELLTERLERRGIDMDEESMRMAIQKGWRLMDDKQRENGSKYEDTEKVDNEYTDEDKEDLAKLIAEESGEDPSDILEQMEKDHAAEHEGDDE